MKLFNGKEDSLYLTRKQWTKLFLAFSVMVLILYTVAMICSLCGSTYFILDYQNTQMDRIEAFLTKYKIMPLLNWVFTTIEFCIIISFILKKFPKWYYVLPFYGIAMIVSATIPSMPIVFYTIYPFVFYIIIPLIDQFVTKRQINIHEYLYCIVRLLIIVIVVLVLQAMILIIKAGYFDGQNHIQNLSSAFIYAIEYDIALSVILFTILLIYREKGDSNLWAMFHKAGSSSQTSKTQSQSSLQKKLTKTQKNKLRRLYVKLYLTQIGAFLLVMILPFILGKVLEFLVMYLAFCVARYILGFKYSLHYKKETICITVGVIVFGILSLAVPFFYVVLIIAIILGIGLAILLHLSYKYKGMFMFAQVAKPDKFALLYTFFDGNLEKNYVEIICRYKGLDHFQTNLILEFLKGEKLSYMAHKRNYSQRMLIYKLDEAIKKLTA